MQLVMAAITTAPSSSSNSSPSRVTRALDLGDLLHRHGAVVVRGLAVVLVVLARHRGRRVAGGEGVPGAVAAVVAVLAVGLVGQLGQEVAGRR